MTNRLFLKHSFPINDWSKWFAWHPVQTDTGWRWITYVYRRRYKFYNYVNYIGSNTWWLYKD